MAKSLQPDDAVPGFLARYCRKRKARLDGAIAALSLQADDAAAHLRLGFALEENSDLHAAIAEYRAAIRLQPDYAAAHFRLGVALYKGDLDGAIAEYRAALRLQPDDAATHYSLGVALKDKGDLGGAIAEYRAAIHLRPGDANAHSGVFCDVLVEKDDRDGTFPELCTVCLRCKLGDALGYKGDLEGAIAEYRTAIRLQPDLFEAHLGLGFALAAKGDLEGAIAEFRTFIQLQLADAEAPYIHISDALVKKGNLDGVIAEFRTAIRLAPNNDVAHLGLGLGLALEMKGDHLAALDEIERLRERFPNDSLFAEAHDRIRRKAGSHG